MDSNPADASLASVVGSVPDALATRPGGSPNDAPDAKLAGIISDMTYLRRDVDRVTGDLKAISALQTDVATIKETLRHIPTWAQQLGTVGATLALIAGLVLFGPNLRKGLGLEPSVPVPSVAQGK